MGEAVLELERVTVSYDGKLALAGVDLEIVAGERVALVGPSGAGKSTLLGLCTATVSPASGTVRVLGRELAHLAPRELRALRRRMATVHQQLHLVESLRVVHNVNAGRLPSWTTARALRSLLRPVDVDSTRTVLDVLGIADRIFERTGSLSGGEQQRVALARALVQEPDLLLADEPVSSLDPARRDDVMDLLTLVSGGQAVDSGRPRTLLVSLHDFDTARARCDRVVGLRAGRIVFDLPAADVTAELGAALYRIQR